MMENRTTFVIAHRLITIRNATKFLVLDSGNIIQVGKHEEIFEEVDGLYKKFYEMQFKDNN